MRPQVPQVFVEQLGPPIIVRTTAWHGCCTAFRVANTVLGGCVGETALPDPGLDVGVLCVRMVEWFIGRLPKARCSRPGEWERADPRDVRWIFRKR